MSSPNSPEPSDTGPATNGKQEPESGELQSTVHREDKDIHNVKEVEEGTNLTSTPDKAPCTLAPLQLSQLRTKNTDSFDMEEVCLLARSPGISHDGVYYSQCSCNTRSSTHTEYFHTENV